MKEERHSKPSKVDESMRTDGTDQWEVYEEPLPSGSTWEDVERLIEEWEGSGWMHFYALGTLATDPTKLLHPSAYSISSSSGVRFGRDSLEYATAVRPGLGGAKQTCRQSAPTEALAVNVFRPTREK